ncbi:hypothetical protein N7G274_004271 [Stereocaulon virgatum]|uniref:RRM domain-containing protein n=1 Tax=Stereocaulon virgatum TaxID=373712 RepID=A0ABR4ACK8_9LECA
MSNNATSQDLGGSLPRDYVQLRNARSERQNTEAVSEKRLGESIRGEDDPRTLLAIAEGRRLYVGNLPYMAKTEDVKDFFAANEYQIEHINMSIDPYSGRNPSYCFVELVSREQAEQAMLELNGKLILGRPVKLGPGVARSTGKHSRAEPTRNARNVRERQVPVFDRWTRTDAVDHWKGYSEKGRRLFVGGLPPMPDHHQVNADVRKLFAGYNIEAVSKVVVPRPPVYGDPKAWNHRFLFVDFPTADEAERAMKATNGRQAWGVKIRVQPAKGPESHKIHERENWEREQQHLS